MRENGPLARAQSAEARLLVQFSDQLSQVGTIDHEERQLLLTILGMLTTKVHAKPSACSWCNRPFTPGRPTARYCTAACKQEAYRDRCVTRP